MGVVPCRLPRQLARLTDDINARVKKVIHVLRKIYRRSSQSKPHKAECTIESDNLKLLGDISWNILSPPETAKLYKPAPVEAVPLPPVLRSRVVLPQPVRLRVYDRGGDKTTQLAIRGTVEDVLQTIHKFYKEMNDKYEEIHPSDASHSAEDETVFGWDTSEPLWYEGIELRDGEYELRTGS
jgi:hypothetical protein